MADFPFDIVGFDLDGTLFDTSHDLAAAVNHALARIGRPPLPAETIVPMIGRGTRHMLAQGLAASGDADPADVDRLLPDLLEFYDANLTHGTFPYPGVLDAMDLLDARGVKLAIVTNKLERLAVKLVGELGLTQRFFTVIGGDTIPGGAKPSPAGIDEMIRRAGGGRTAFVGDSIFDTGAARAAGVPSIAVSFGFLAGPIEELDADAVIDHYDELIPALERLASSKSAPAS